MGMRPPWLISIPLRYNLEFRTYHELKESAEISIPLRYNLERMGRFYRYSPGPHFNSTKVQFGVEFSIFYTVRASISIPLRYNLESTSTSHTKHGSSISIPLRYNLETPRHHPSNLECNFNSTKVQFGASGDTLRL